MDQHTKKLYFEDKNHTPYDFPYNTYLCSIPLDFSVVKPHWHKEVELIVVKKGRGIVSIDLTLYHVKAGDILIVCPGQLHTIKQEADHVMEYENILFKPELMKSSGIDYCNDNFMKPLFSGSVRFYPLLNENASIYEGVMTLINQIDSLRDKRPFAYQIAIKGYLFQIFYLIISAHPDELNQVDNRKSVEKLKQILTYMEEHYTAHISISEMADYCSYSESYFMKFFKQHMGIGFIQYLNDYRLEKAAEQLINTEDVIIDIASRAGFDNLSYFNRCFKKKYNISPGNYRKTKLPQG